MQELLQRLIGSAQMAPALAQTIRADGFPGIVFTEVSLSSQRRRITEQVAAVKPYILGFSGCTRFVFGYSFGRVVWPADRAGRAQTFDQNDHSKTRGAYCCI